MPVKSRVLMALFLGCTIYFCFSQHKSNTKQPVYYALANKLFLEASKLSGDADFDKAKAIQQENLNRKALFLFKDLISAKPPGITDSILFHCYLKAGLLMHFFDSLPQAKTFYLHAISFHGKLPAIKDSFLFKPYLFTGSILYAQNLFDSALIFYKKAEQVIERYNNSLEETERLYNRMGVIYYEAGNYRLADNYFQKAISVLSPADPSYKNLLVNYRMNIASIMIKLQEYKKADSLFQTIVPFHVYLNEINHNLGIVQFRMKKYAEALQHFRQVHYGNNVKNIELYYNMAQAFSALQQKDSSEFYINKALIENERINGKKKNSSLGLALKFVGDEKVKSNEPFSAVVYYQQAVGQFYPAFNDTNIYSVPSKYSGVFSYINLFQTLIAKGDLFGMLYKRSNNKIELRASFDAYKSAFELADYVAKTYDSDDARLFLNQIKYISHSKAITSSLALYELMGNKSYLEEAYLFDQRNKASVLTLALQESSIKKKGGISESISLQQSSVRSTITRLSIEASHLTDPGLLTKLNNEIRDNEIKLARIQEQIKSNPQYAGIEPSIQIPLSEKLRNMLDNETALLSYHLTTNELLIFCITKHHFEYVKQAIDSSFIKNIQSLIVSLRNTNQAVRYNGSGPAFSLYQVLIKPILSWVENKTHLIIIPDDELNDIPFETLVDEHKKFLLESYAIQYQYSTALLQLNEIRTGGGNELVLGFAPFTGVTGDSQFQTLPYSKEEISHLNGKVFLGSNATKQHFIENANKYPILHLATHAVANNELPLKSFIAFYPQQSDSSDKYILYAQEIYNLSLDSIRLVILSACETGSGQLIKGEGLMSITRAFSYAGCSNIITSLWKAADRTTAFITQRLYTYLDKGYSRNRSLQLAKLDLLNSTDIPPSLKTPNYWAHLIFIGNYEPAAKSFHWWWLGAGLAVTIVGYIIYKNKSRIFAGHSGVFSKG